MQREFIQRAHLNIVANILQYARANWGVNQIKKDDELKDILWPDPYMAEANKIAINFV